MGDVRISVRPARSANAQNLLLMVDGQILDLGEEEAAASLKPGEHTVSAILTRKDGESGPVSGEVTLQSENGDVIDTLQVEVADWGEINQVKKTVRIG